MSTDTRDVLDVLKFELKFLEDGGYGRSVRTPWRPTSLFQDSLTCLNFGEKEKVHPCNECLLWDFVPPDKRDQQVPCHHIPLEAGGQTIGSLDSGDNQQSLEESLKNWLRATIARLEAEEAQKAV